ncbi:hypothetical protein HNP86_001075 [Methanococcus maripaludis]|uniref:PEGA domain-containing protein n=1 Tax=Methanococcus maripaludis TaxID=39152 RepID=A0A7J9NUG5_METMI|nr:PEGA domain-containing protein [Methanococcus maripaludis]MBA2850944.1 hypothetical protein [Methanococcus maripaludis]
MFKKISENLKKIFMVTMVLLSCVLPAAATNVTFNTNGIDGIEVYNSTGLVGTINDSGVLDLPDSAVNYTLVKEYYDNETVEVDPTLATECNVTLELTEYVVQINANVESCDVYEDGVLLGAYDNTSQVLSLTYGTYYLTFSKTGYENVSMNLTVPGVTEINVSMSEIVEETTEEENTTTTEETEDVQTAILIAYAEGDDIVDIITENKVFFGLLVVVFIIAIVGNMPKGKGFNRK